MDITIILITLLVGAIATYAIGDKHASKVAVFFSGVSVLLSIALLFQYGTTETNYVVEWVKNPNIAFALKVDGLAIAMLLMTTILTTLIIVAIMYVKRDNLRTLFSLILLSSFAMVGVFLSSDAILYYVFWELSLIPVYFITVMWGNGAMDKRRKAAMTFFLVTFAGSLFMLASIIFLYTKVGSFRLEDFYNANLTSTEQLWVFLGFFLAYAIKIPIFSFHTWQPAAYQHAPMAGTMILAGLMSKMGAFSVLRWQLPVAPEAAMQLRPYILILCIVGVVYGTVLALKQDNIKRFLAYISMSHVGFLAAGLYSLTFEGILGAILLMLAHSIGIIALYYDAAIIYKRTRVGNISQLGGIRNQAPVFTGAFFVTVLTAISIPLSFNFVGEVAIMLGLYTLNIWYMVIIGSTMFLGAYVMLRMYQNVMLGEKKLEKFEDLNFVEICIFATFTSIFFIFGIYSKPIVELVTPSIEVIMSYINR